MIHADKGNNDILPGAHEPDLDSGIWDHLLGTAQAVLESYGYRHVLLPTVEETALFARGIGEDTDIVSKEMYTFTDRGERSLTLRPEGTASAVRAYVEHGFGKTDPVQRWWYLGPMFRAERPQKGRYRQFYQVGAEFLGVSAPSADAELLVLVWRLCEALGVTGVTVRVNSLGDADSRAAYREVLRAHLQAHKEQLCESCRGRIDTNPLRVLDCKREGCREVARSAPDILESLTPASRAHFEAVQQLVAAAGVPYSRDAHLVRGLDYYTGTIFELTTSALGAQDAVLGGGRYDDLVAQLDGPPTPAIGFAAGLERLALLVAATERGAALRRRGPDLYIVPMAGAEGRALTLADELRRQVRPGTGAPFRVEVDVSGGKLKHQMRRADRVGALTALVLGENELQSGQGALKLLRAAESTQRQVRLEGSALAAALGEVIA